MAELGDIFKEWEKLNTAGKIAVGGAAAAVALIALAASHRATSSSTGGSLAGNTPDTIAAGIVSGLQQALGNGATAISSGVGTVTGTPTPAPTTPTATPTTPTPAPTPTAPTPPPTWTQNITTYTVQPGDWLSKIVQSHPAWGVSWQQLYAANTGVIGGNPNLIRPGQVLKIPGR